MSRAQIGVFGGSGFYRWLEDVEQVTVDTPYGPPSDAFAIGTLGGRRIAFLPRHGARHQVPAPRVNYRANLWAMRELGVRRVLGPCAVGSLRKEVAPGDLVICDQFVDRTTGRADTFYLGPEVVHVSSADPYCPQMRALAIEAATEAGWRFHPRGTCVVIQGPRFSTRAESRWFSGMGWDVVGMTQYPEAILARELEMCYANLSLVTDYDVGVEGEPGIHAVETVDVMRVMADNVTRVRDLLRRLIPSIPEQPSCRCQQALAGARVES